MFQETNETANNDAHTHAHTLFNFDDHVLVDTGMHHQSNESIFTTLSLPVYTNVRIMNWHRRHGGSRLNVKSCLAEKSRGPP